MLDLTETLATSTPPKRDRKLRNNEIPTLEGEWNGTTGYIQTGLMEEMPSNWDEVIRQAGFDPEFIGVREPVNTRFWDAAIGNGEVRRMHHFMLSLFSKKPPIDLDEIVKAAKRAARATPAKTNTDTAFCVLAGDLQIGKLENDTEGLIERFIEKAVTSAVARYKRVAKGSTVYLIYLGDCIEGHVSQGGANSWRTPLTTTEQVRIYRRLVREQVLAFAAVAPEVVLVGIPGNHDEAIRPIQTYGDSWATETLVAIKDALDLAGRYDHVTVIIPERDELTVTLDICGTVVTMAHGHQFRGGVDGWKKWWQGQQYGRHAPGDADVLLAGHLHHLRIIEEGTSPGTPSRTFIQVPAMETESTWYRHRAGAGGKPGIVTLLVGGGAWSSLEVL